MIDEFGWLNHATHIASPNFDERPDQEIALLVIHNISLPPEQFSGEGVIQFFTNQLNANEHPYYQHIAHVQVSAHLFIRRDGSIIQFVPFLKRAWHAGASTWQGRTRCNDFSIGIELEGSDHSVFTEQQYLSLIDTTKLLRQHYPINGIAGHQHIAPERKTDPGPYFNWALYLSGLCSS